MEKTKTNIENINNASEINERSDKKNIFILTKVKRVKNWTEEEDELLMTMAEKYDFKNWNGVADHLTGRSAIQCSARYKRIRPGIIKGAWTEEEDELLLDLLKRFGKNWSLISKYMPSRSGKQIRDRFLNALDPTILKDKFTAEEDKKILELYAAMGSQWSKIALYLHRRTGDMIKNRFYSSLRRKIHNDDYREGLKLKKLKIMESSEHGKNIKIEGAHTGEGMKKEKLNSSITISDLEYQEKNSINKNDEKFKYKTHYNNNKHNFPLKRKTKRDVFCSVYNNSSTGPRHRIKLNKNLNYENKPDQNFGCSSLLENNPNSFFKVDRLNQNLEAISNKINYINSSNIKCQQADFIISKNDSHNYLSTDRYVNSANINKENNNFYNNFNFSTIQQQSSSQVHNNKNNNFINPNILNLNNFFSNNFINSNNPSASQTLQNYLVNFSNQNKLNVSNKINNNLINNLPVFNTQLNSTILNANNLNMTNYQNFNNLMSQSKDQSQLQGKALNMEIFNSLSNATNPGLSHQNIQNLNNQLQQNILNNLLLLKQEQNILNFNVVDYQMTQNINQLLQNNFISQGTNSKSDLENQLSTLKHLLDCTFLKLDHVKKNDIPMAVSGGSLNMEASQNIYIKNEEGQNIQIPSLGLSQTTLKDTKTLSSEVPALKDKSNNYENVSLKIENQE